MKRIGIYVACALGVAVLAGCATAALEPDYGKMAQELLRQDFRTKGPATMERMLNQDEAQKLCTEYPLERPADVAAKIEAAQLKSIVYPADGKYLGKWQEGEKIAQSGRGMQSSDAIGSVNGGNCYACHQIAKHEISFGNIGPS